MKIFAVLLILLVAASAAFAGCSSGPAPSSPTITITSPVNGAMVTGSSIPVTVQVSNFNVVDKQGQTSVAGEGHVHFYLDVSPVPSDPSKPAIPASAQAAWAHISGTSYTFTNVSPGMHTITVQLVNNDHTPVVPLVTQSVMVTAAAAGGSAAAPASAPGAAPPADAAAGPTTTVTLTAQNVLFDKQTITVPAGAKVAMTFNNLDSGVAHNFALYTDSSAKTRIFVGDFVTGVKTTTYTFTAPSKPGNYFFRCDVHPTIMYGTFVVT